jgi:aspartate/methionine/tyrosine aminotransferase
LFEQTLRENPDIGLLILNDPVNPSGVKLSKEELIEIGEVLTKPEFSNIFILIDDTYHELCYGDAVC